MADTILAPWPIDWKLKAPNPWNYWQLVLNNGTLPSTRMDQPGTICQLLAHFVTAERGFLVLIDEIAAGGAGSPEDFDINRFKKAKFQRLAMSFRKI